MDNNTDLRNMNQKQLMEFALAKMEETKRLRSELNERKGLNRPYTVKYGEHKGVPVICIAGPIPTFRFGRRKAKAIVAMFDNIKSFAEKDELDSEI